MQSTYVTQTFLKGGVRESRKNKCATQNPSMPISLYPINWRIYSRMRKYCREKKRAVAQSQLGSTSLNHVVTCSVLSCVSKPRKGQWVKRGTFLTKEEILRGGKWLTLLFRNEFFFGSRRFFFRFSHFRNASSGRIRPTPIFVVISSFISVAFWK